MIFVDGIGDDYSICVSQIIVSIHPPAWFLAIFRCGIRVGWSSKSCEGRAMVIFHGYVKYPDGISPRNHSEMGLLHL